MGEESCRSFSSLTMVPITLEGIDQSPSANTVEEHWKQIRKCLWKQLLKQERNQSRIFYNGNHLLSPCGANVVFR